METKPELRRRMRRFRKGLNAQECAAASQQVVTRLGALPEVATAQTLALYSALPGEVDVMAVAHQAWAVGGRVALPRVLGPGAMGFFLYTPETPLVRSELGVLEPMAGAPAIPVQALDGVVLPGLAYDVHGTRLGFGAGYYDRALATAARAVRIGVAFDAQLVEAVPSEAHDLPVDLVVTERRVLRVA